MGDLILDLFRNIETKGTISCKGLTYKAQYNNYHNGRDLICSKLSLKLLKRKSCKGCEYCDWLEEDLRERLSNGEFNGVIFDNIENGKLYTPYTTNQSTDWETGMMDDWDVAFQEIKE